jgi:D-serine deaminase-like pyridoxal phosphate-dependent protein
MIKDIDTPALVVDLNQMEKNISKMTEKSHNSGIKLRPHIKTHKSPTIALRQIEAGADGITVAKLGEAEVMSKHGIKSILIAYPIVGDKKLNRLEKLSLETDVITSLDSVEVAKGISNVGKRLGKTMPVYVEVDTGLGRVGRKHGQETFQLIENLLDLPFIEIRGLMTHAGHSYKSKTIEEMKEISKKEGEFLVQTKNLVKEKLNLNIPEVSVGSTPTSYVGGQVQGVTEMRPGTYVFNDSTMEALGLVDEDECALTIYATVVSKPSHDRLIIDAGSKTLSSDKSIFTEGHGLLKQNRELTLSWLSEEHGVIHIPENADADLNIGDMIEVIPNHVCPTVNLTDELIGIRDGKVEEIIQVEARGKNK